MAAPIEPVTANDGFAVTPSDTTVFRLMAAALYVGTGGSVVVRTRGGSDVTFANVPDGTILPIRCDMVKASTGASNIVALVY